MDAGLGSVLSSVDKSSPKRFSADHMVSGYGNVPVKFDEFLLCL